jgi:UDP-perosamine 4-acetyltransferase
MSRPYLVLGGGGHAKVLIDALLLQSADIVGYTVPTPENKDPILGVPCIGNDEAALKYSIDSIRLINGLGSVRLPHERRRLFEEFKQRGYLFESVVHPSVLIANHVELSEGVQLMAGSIIQTGSYIGKNTIVNTKASVDHDCVIGDHVHLAPGVTLSGEVAVGNGVHIGTGATVIQGVRIGDNSLIGAGALVLNDVPENSTVMGVPAREVQR